MSAAPAPHRRTVSPRRRAQARAHDALPLAVDIAGACELLGGISWDCWAAYVAPEVSIVRLGKRKLVAVAELERFLDEHAERVLP